MVEKTTSRIVFGDDKGQASGRLNSATNKDVSTGQNATRKDSTTPQELATAKETEARVYSHWLLEAKEFLLSQKYLNNEQLQAMAVSDLTKADTEIMKNLVQEWIKPRSFFGEAAPQTPTPSERELMSVLNWLVRVVYEEMYQINKPEDGKIKGIQSAGGLLTHVDLNAEVMGADLLIASLETKHKANLVRSANALYQRRTTELQTNLSAKSLVKLKETFGLAEDAKDVYTVYREIWDVLREKIDKVLNSRNIQVLEQTLKMLLTVRTTPEFQFLFTSPFAWKV